MEHLFQAVMLTVNYITLKQGKFGTFAEMLCSVVNAPSADKVAVRIDVDAVEAIKAKMAELAKEGKKLTARVDLIATEVGGVIGVRSETYTNKQSQEVTQTAVYYRFATTPEWAKADKVNAIGNLNSL